MEKLLWKARYRLYRSYQNEGDFTRLQRYLKAVSERVQFSFHYAYAKGDLA